MANPLRQLLRPKSSADYTAQLVADGKSRPHSISAAAPARTSIGSGPAWRPPASTPTPMPSTSPANAAFHDHYIQANILEDDIDEQFDLVTLYGLIEHLPKSDGLRLLDRVEKLSCKYILLETPHGFVPQGPEFGNEFQRHHSGWFIQEFEGRGYTVHGTTGTRHLRGYMAGPKYNFPGCLLCDELLTLLLRINRKPKHAFNLVAIKDVRGVPARHGKEAQP